MAELIEEVKLQEKLVTIFQKARSEIVIVSPFIHLHDRFKAELERKKADPRIKLTILFGKNPDAPAKSIRQEDLEFFKEFTNVEIRYEPRLHAKYYANERQSIITSLNLVAFSTNHNVEVGVYSTSGWRVFRRFPKVITNFFQDDLDEDAFKYFRVIIRSSECLYLRKSGVEVTNELGRLHALSSDKNRPGTSPKASDVPDGASEESGSFHNQTDKPGAGNGSAKVLFITTSKLAERCGLSPSVMNNRLETSRYIEKLDGKHILTSLGRQAGGRVRTGPHGEFIVWPEAMFD
jgi:hypothetical protein